MAYPPTPPARGGVSSPNGRGEDAASTRCAKMPDSAILSLFLLLKRLSRKSFFTLDTIRPPQIVRRSTLSNHGRSASPHRCPRLHSRHPILGLPASFALRVIPWLVLAVALRASAETKPRTLAIDSERRYQTIEHFGASDCWSMQKLGAWSEAGKNRVADLLFSMTDGIGLSCWRFNIGAGPDPGRIGDPWRTAECFEQGPGVYDWSRQAGERWFLRAAKARGVPYFLAFANSPPARMTRNGHTNADGGRDTSNLKEGYEPQFAAFLADVLAHFRDTPDAAEQVNFDYVSPVNEPHVSWDADCGQEGCRYSNADIKRVVLALNDALKTRRLATQIRVPESNTFKALLDLDVLATRRYGTEYGGYLRCFAEDPELSACIGQTLCAHGYGAEPLQRIFLRIRGRVGGKLAEYPGWKLWMSEFCVMKGPLKESGGPRDLSMETALWVARAVHYDLTRANASAWHWWTAVSKEDYKDGLIYTDCRHPGDPESVIPSKLLWALGNYSRFVRPGMIRVELSGANRIDGLLGSAYLDQARRRLVLVFVNMQQEPVRFGMRFEQNEWTGPDTVFTPFLTSEAPGDDLRACTPLAAGDLCTVPGRSVLTLCSGNPG